MLDNISHLEPGEYHEAFFVVLVLTWSVCSLACACDMNDLLSKGVKASVVSVEDAEKDSMDLVRRMTDIPQVPFGYMNDQWKRFIKKYDRETDCLVRFSGDMNAEGDYRGVSGYMIQRNGVLIDIIYLSIQ